MTKQEKLDAIARAVEIIDTEDESEKYTCCALDIASQFDFELRETYWVILYSLAPYPTSGYTALTRYDIARRRNGNVVGGFQPLEKITQQDRIFMLLWYWEMIYKNVDFGQLSCPTT